MQAFIGRHGGKLLAIGICILGYFFTTAVVTALELQVTLIRAFADTLAYLVPAAYGGSVLRWVVGVHDALVGLAELLAGLPTRFLPSAVTDVFPNGVGSG